LTLLGSVFHKLLELVLLIDSLRVSLREEVLLGAAPSRYAAAASTSPKSWRPWWQPGSIHAPKYQLRHGGDGGGVFHRQGAVVPWRLWPGTTAAATNADHVELVGQRRHGCPALPTACDAAGHALVGAAAHSG
jgi:hypothetical protein